jgi:4-hydroxybenzoate polyprenyltransferase
MAPTTMDLDPTLLMLSLMPSGVGFVLFVYGRKNGRWPQLAMGLALMVYPYFAGSVVTLASVGVLLAVALYLMIQAGW